MVGDHDARFADESEAPELHHSDRHLRGLAGADAVKQPDGGLGDDPGDGGPLVRLRGERPGQPGERQLRAGSGVVAQDEAVEPPVVLVEEPARPVGLLPAPFREALLHRLRLLLGGCGFGRVHDAADAFAVVDLVGDLDRSLLDRGLGDLPGRHPAGAPFRGRAHGSVVGAHGPDRAAGMLDLDGVVVEDLREELPVRRGVDPRGPQSRLDVLDAEVGG